MPRREEAGRAVGTGTAVTPAIFSGVGGDPVLLWRVLGRGLGEEEAGDRWVGPDVGGP